MYELARLARVVYVTGREDIRELVKKAFVAGHAAPAPFTPPSGLELLSSRWPRTHRWQTLDEQLFKGYVRRLQKHLDAGTSGRRVVYAWNPSCIGAVRLLSYEMLIYHPYDMFRHFVNSSEVLIQQEDELCRLADAVVTPHGRIAEALGHRNTHVISNGVFLPAFPFCEHPATSQLFKHLQRPIIGNLGVINDKIDFALLLEVFSARPEWQLVFVGFEGAGQWKTSSAYLALHGLKNVHFLGGVPIDKVAQIIASFDLGIIPYEISGWAQFIESPLKLYQYWAVGIPVVSSPLPTLETQAGALEVCSTAEEWQAGIERQLTLQNADLGQRLRARAEGNSWAAKAEQVVEIIRNEGGKLAGQGRCPSEDCRQL